MRGYPNANAPSWLASLQLAAEWGMNPETIHNGRGMLKWINRWNAWQKALKRSAELDKQRERNKPK